ncbi:hypothetical protein ACU4GA_27255 [Methylobacterium oryzae CBMB20]
MMKQIGDLLMQMHGDLEQAYRLPAPNGPQILSAVQATDGPIGSAIHKTPEITKARGDFHNAVDRATSLSPQRIQSDPARCREEYRRTLVALHAYSLALDKAEPSALGSDTYDMSDVPNPVPMAPSP